MFSNYPFIRTDYQNVFASRVSNRTIKLENHKFPDSDVVMLEDIQGHRYTRTLPINPKHNFSYFTMI